MSQIFDEKGNVVPVTLIEAGPCFVTQIKGEKDGYESVQIGFEKLKEHKIRKSQKSKPYKYVREFRGDIDVSKLTKDELESLVDIRLDIECSKLKVSNGDKI